MNIRFFKYLSHPASLVRPPTFVTINPGSLRMLRHSANQAVDRDPSFDTELIAQEPPMSKPTSPLRPSV